MKKIILLIGLLSFFPAFAGIKDCPVNLLQTGKFKPVTMHGKTTAAYGWFFLDWARFKYIRSTISYVSGEDCFRFDCRDGVASFRFHEPLNKVYTNSKDFLFFGSRVGWPSPPAPEYVSGGNLKFNKGRIRLLGKDFKPGAEWQSFKMKSKYPLTGISFKPVGGSEFYFSDFYSYAVYPEMSKGIRLDDGSMLTKFVLEENADYITRWGVALWRGWIWKLTGQALPIEIVKKAVPQPGAFVVVRDKLPLGGWKLTMNKSGCVLAVYDEFSVVPALFDYLRKKLDCAFYSQDTQKVPADGSIKQLPTIDRLVKPRFGTITGDSSILALNGGRHLPQFSTLNDVNYYHLPNPHNDHVFNVVLPNELYGKTHPEYYMLDRNNKRYIDPDPYRINPCFSNPEAKKLMLQNLKDYAANQSVSKIVTFLTGDASNHCLCKDCVKFNGGEASNTESQFEFANLFAPILAKVRPDMKFTRLAYTSYHAPPKVNLPKYDNIIFCYCAGESLIPCTLHVDCEINRKGLEEIKAWGKLAKTPERLGYMTYSDIRPLQFAKRMEHYSKFGNAYIYMFQWRGYSPAVSFVINRWNLGEDAEEVLREFDYYYYGKGGKYVHEINLLVEKFASSYKHTAEEKKQLEDKHLHLGIWSSGHCMNRELLDRIYALFDKALAAAGNDKMARRHILREKSLYLIEDLLKWNRATCRNSDELKKFAARLADFIRIAAEFPQDYRHHTQLVPGLEGRAFVLAVAGLDIPDTGKDWAREKAAQDYIKNPMALFRTDPVITPGAWYFPADRMVTNAKLLYYDYLCPPRVTVALRRPSLQQDRLSVLFDIKQKPSAGYLHLSVEGLDDEKPGYAPILIMVNGKEVFRGLNKFPERGGWGRMSFSVPAEFLKIGENNVTIRNISPDIPSRSTRFANQEDGRHDHQWGWICLSEVYLCDFGTDFANFVSGSKDSGWAIISGNVRREKGKLFLSSEKNRRAVIARSQKNDVPGFSVNSGDVVVIEVRGNDLKKADMQLNIREYKGYAAEKSGKQKVKRSGFLAGKELRNTALTPVFSKDGKTAKYEFTVGKDTGLIAPEISAGSGKELELCTFSMNLKGKK